MGLYNIQSRIHSLRGTFSINSVEGKKTIHKNTGTNCMKRLKIYLVDDHVLFRQGLKFLLSNASFIEEVYEAGDGESFVNSLSELHPDIALVDIEMPGMSGIDATQKALQITKWT